MSWQSTPHVFVLLFAGVVASGWAVYGLTSTWRSDRQSHVTAFVLLNLAVAQWAFVYAFQVASPSPSTKLLAFKFLHVGGVIVPPTWFLFAAAYTDSREWLTPPTVVALLPVPVALLLALPTNPASLAYTELTLVTVDSLRLLEVEIGPVYLLFLAYSYVLLLAGGYLLVRTALRQNRTFTGPSTLLVLGVAGPFIVNVLDVAKLFPPGGLGINYTPVSLAFSAFIFGIAVFRYQVFDLTPIARETVLETVHDGVVVLNDAERVVDTNPAARRIFDLDADAVGRPAEDVLPSYTELVTGEDDHLTLTLDDGSTHRLVELSRSPIGTDGPGGQVVLAHDVTTRVERRRRIEQQNERLDAFAGIVAHDLRNPLSVISGRTELARQTDDTAHLEAVVDAIDRMDGLLERLLTLSRRGETIAEREPVLLSSIATEAWSLVETADATLDTEADVTVEADPATLQEAFENLFRNAVEHVGPTVAVRVGPLEERTGFYVEDDGPGMPADLRETAFDAGVSTGSEGIGLGLNIVHEIVAAHDWSIAVTDAPEGGCRFEVEDGPD